MSKIIVTGGAGFIGSNLVDQLVNLNNEVVVIDNLSSGKREYLNPKAKFYENDICDQVKIEEIFNLEKPEFVFHLAAQIDVRISVANPELDNKINVLGGLNILDASRKIGLKKIIFISTGGAIYGDTDKIPTKEGHPEMPLSPYGIHKLTFEKYLNYYHKVYGLEYMALRLANVYGPRQYKGGEAGVVSIFTDHAVLGKKISIFGDGKQTRDFVYVDDVVSACISSLNVNFVGPINISTGKESDLLTMIALIEKNIGHELEKEFLPAKAGEQRRSALSYKQAKKILAWKPRKTLKTGLKSTVKWAKNR